jgi:hypothetical protein
MSEKIDKFKRSYALLLLAVIIIIVFSAGCSSIIRNTDNIAYISSNTDSEYVNTFRELQLGTLFDFNLKLTDADKSWVNIWVEGYKNGKAVEPLPITKLSYGLSPAKVEEGHIGFGIINSNNTEQQFFLYTKGCKTAPYNIDNDFFDESAISMWDYAIGCEPIGLEHGEEKVLAVYRQRKESVKAGYNYQDSASIKQIINEDLTVLLLKIKVEKRDKL